MPLKSFGMGAVREKLKRRRRPIAIGIAFLVCLNVFLAYIGVYGGNIHAVVPDQMYRSAQLTGSNLDQEIHKDHISSIINLRGASPDSAAYQSEIQVCKQDSVIHDDVGLSAHRFPSPQDVTELLKDFQRLPKPILIHCKAGSDRTGLVATLFVALQPNASLDEAEHKELTWRYGHFGLFGTQAMDNFFDLYRKTSNGQSLRDWLQKTYPGEYRQLQLAHSWEVSSGPGGE